MLVQINVLVQPVQTGKEIWKLEKKLHKVQLPTDMYLQNV